jgi:protein-disulfide isomerase
MAMIGQSTTSRLTLPVSDRDHSIGPATAPLTLVEYGDYECPYCRAAHFIVLDLLRQLGDQLRYVFRNFPLVDIHPHAERAAEAAEAAGAQGKFWEMHHVLFEDQPNLALSDLLGYAAGLGLDLQRFESDLATHTFVPRIAEDLLSGARSGVNGTPTFFINGSRYTESWDEPTLLGALQEVARQRRTQKARRGGSPQ